MRDLMKNIDVSCIVTGHRESHIISATLKSVHQACEYATECGVATELIVVLDNPDHDTLDVAESFTSNFCQVMSVNNNDLAESRNYAAQQANGKYISFLDGDDLWCKTWVVDTFRLAKLHSGSVFHPEYNIYFGDEEHYVFNHLDMTDADFIAEAIYRNNYWTALSFAEKQIFLDYPYKRNRINEGFGYEDWTWNVETVNGGIVHRTVRGTCHYIRRSSGGASLLNITNSSGALPTILPIYEKFVNKPSKVNETATSDLGY